MTGWSQDATPARSLAARDRGRTGPTLGRREVLMGGLFGGLAAASYALAPNRSVAPLKRGILDTWMPPRIGNYEYTASSGVVLPPADELSDRLYDNLVTRVYSAPNSPPIMLMLAYSSTQDGMLQVHRPEFCYEANGFDLTPTRKLELSRTSGRRFGGNSFLGRSPTRSEQVVYWTRIGSAFPQSWTAQRLAVMEDNLQGRIPDGLLARVSLADPEDSSSMAALTGFIFELSTAASPRLRRILFGSS